MLYQNPMWAESSNARRSFSVKLEFALKALSLSRGRIAAELGVDKSVVGRWARGAVKPSAENLGRLTALVAARVEAFTVLDWDRDLAGLAQVLGVDPETMPQPPPEPLALGLLGRLLEKIHPVTERRGKAYEGLYLSTRPYPDLPGRFIHDRMMIRRDESALLHFDLVCGQVAVEGWVIPQQNQLFVIGTENATGSLAFGVFNGVSATQAGLVEGLLLGCALDAHRTPTACAMVFERVGDLCGDASADEARFAQLRSREGLAPQGSVPEDLIIHLTRDTGRAQLALGGDWLLRLPLARSLSRGVPAT